VAPRALMFTYRFPPCVQAPTAAARAEGLARYLPDFGWDPVVVAPARTSEICGCVGCQQPEDRQSRPYELVRLPLRVRPGVALARRLARLRTTGPATGFETQMTGTLSAAASLVEVKNDWVRASTYAGREIADSNGVEVTWTTSRPLASALTGRRLQRSSGLPWVAELRDLVSVVRSRDPLATAATRVHNAALRPALRRASAVVTVTPELAEADGRWLGREIDVVRSGFDPELWPDLVPAPRNDRFTLVYAGRFLPGYREPDPALAALARLAEQLPEWREWLHFRYYGPAGARFRQAAEHHGVSDLVSDGGFVSGPAYTQALRVADVLVLLTNLAGESGIPGGKLYDYLAARRPVTAGPPRDGFVDRVLQDVGAGTTATTEQELCTQLAAWFEEWRATGSVAYRGDRSRLAKYSVRHSAQQLAAVLDRVAET